MGVCRFEGAKEESACSGCSAPIHTSRPRRLVHCLIPNIPSTHAVAPILSWGKPSSSLSLLLDACSPAHDEQARRGEGGEGPGAVLTPMTTTPIGASVGCLVQLLLPPQS